MSKMVSIHKYCKKVFQGSYKKDSRKGGDRS